MKRMCLFLIMFCTIAAFSHGAARAQDVKVGLAWFGKSTSATQYRELLEKAFQKKAPAIQLEIQADLASADKLAEVVARFEQEKAGMIILRSEGAQWLAEHPPAIPAFIGGGNHPVILGVLKHPEAPEGKITGVSYYIPIEPQFEIFRAILPNLNSIWLLLEKGHPTTEISREETKTYCDAHGIRYYESLSANKDEILAAVAQASQAGVSAIVLSNSTIVTENAAAIVAAAGKVPTLSFSSVSVKDGVLGGFTADVAKLVDLLVDSVVAVVVNGKAIKDVPVKFDTDPKFFINERTANRLQITIPYQILKYATVIK